MHPGIVLSTREKGGGDAFFQKRVPKGAPDYLETARIEFPSGRHADEICPTEIAVVGWAAQMGTITFHPWPVRRDDVDHPDELRLDLDPQPGTDFDDAVRVAGVARELLDDLGYAGFPKTSGGRGVHIYVRIEPRWTFTDVRHAAIAFGRELERRLPGEVTTKWWKEERGERIFVDYNQNARDRTIASAYSVRPKPGAPVSAPVTWDELAEVAPEDFTVATMPARFAEVGDRHAAIDDVAHSLEPLLEMYERDEAEGEGDMPYPPDYPKMPGEPKRVQPSRDRDRKTDELAATSPAAASSPRAWSPGRRRRHDRPDVAVRRLVEVDDHRRVVARPAALARLAVDPRRPDALGHRPAREDQVDPHAEVLVEHAGAVVPVGEDALVRPAVAHDVVQAERLELARAPRARAASRASGRRTRPDRRRRRRWARCSCRRTTIGRRPARRRPRRAARAATRACTRSGPSPARARSARRPSTTRTPPQVAAIARASGCGKPGRVRRAPRTTSSSPTRERIATPFHVASPWAATS